MTGRLCAVDVETSGTDPARHHAWDIAVVALGPDEEGRSEHQWFIKPTLATADPYALRVGHYYERTAGLNPPGSRKQGAKWSDPVKAAAELAQLLDGATLVGHNVPFDADFIGAFLRRQAQILTADYHLVNVADLVRGYIAGQRRACKAAQLNAAIRREPVAGWNPPEWPAGRHLADMAEAVGVDPAGYEQHTALGDARLAMAVYQAVMDGAA